MAEFKTHHTVSRLIELLRCDSTMREECVELLTTGGNSFGPISVVTAKAGITRHCAGKAHEFLHLYNRIKSTRSNELDPMVYILGKIVDSPELCDFLTLRSSHLASSKGAPLPKAVPSAPKATISDDELLKLRNDLAAATNAIRRGPSPAPFGSSSTASNAAASSASHSTAVPSVLAGSSLADYARKYENAPAWLESRPFLTADFPAVTRAAKDPAVPIGTLPVAIQEVAVVDDILYTMSGVEGKYIRITRDPAHPARGLNVGQAPAFDIDSTLDPSLKSLVERIIPICVYYSNIARLTDGKGMFSDGVVRQAFCSAVARLVKEYLIVVAQLETQYRKGQLSLQKLWFYVQPCLKTMEMLSALAVDVVTRDLKGGALLSLLHTQTMGYMGDRTAQELSLHLVQVASAPYFDMLEQWIYNGVVDDTFNEFMVKEDKGLDREFALKMYNDSYWERRYTISTERTPSFLVPMADKILRTGKYLNVIRESSREPRCPNAVSLMYQIREREYIGAIEDAFAYASKSLITLLTADLDLMGQLASIKSYFCMLCGDFFAHFIDIAEGELVKVVRDIEPSRLSALLELALRVSSASNDPFKDNLTVGLVPHTLVTELFRIMNITHDHKGNERGFIDPETFALDGPDNMEGSSLTGLEALTFEYTVQWPMSLVISRKSLKRYQLLFRHLFHCRQVERVLCNTWRDDQVFKENPHIPESARAAAFALRQRMLNFVQSFQYYSMYEVIEPNWHVMADKLSTASTIDDVLTIHSNFLDTCLKECMLTNPSSLKTISKLLSVCSVFGTGMKNIASEAAVAPNSTDRLTASTKFESSMSGFNKKFTAEMHQLLDSLAAFATSATEQHMSNMVARLDFNGYYTQTRGEHIRPSGRAPPP
eukprot:m.626168 g.626168  ORF g.626168 m.626168 type:complete len:884 (+) comp22551_c1_seq6:142-2793(+)